MNKGGILLFRFFRLLIRFFRNDLYRPITLDLQEFVEFVLFFRSEQSLGGVQVSRIGSDGGGCLPSLCHILPDPVDLVPHQDGPVHLVLSSHRPEECAG